MQAAPMFDTKPLLRPNQIEETKSEIKSLEAKLLSPHIEDKGEVAKQLRRMNKSFAEQVPHAPESAEEEGKMVRRSSELLGEILNGMPSQEEMRKCPPGAVDKHMKWEARNKQKIQEWKNLQIRLSDGKESEAANLERHRPTSSSLNMDNAQIPGKLFYLPPVGAGLPTSFNDEQIAYLRQVSPELADKLALMSNDQRKEVKQVLEGGVTQAQIDGMRGVEKREAMKAERKAKEEKKRGRKPMTDEQRAAAGERLKAARAAKKATKVEEE